jgi:hypothetical protein
MITHISDDVRELVSTWPDGDYMIEPSSEGRHGFFKDATFVVIRSGRIVSHFQSLWCGNGVEGETYRQHRNGERKAYYPRLERAHDYTRQWAELMHGPDVQVSTDDVLEFFP